MSLGMERNADDGFRIVCKRDGDGVSRVLSHSYNARDTHDGVPTYFIPARRRGAPYRRPLTLGFTAPGGRPRSIMAVENGPSIDSCTARLPARRGWMASLREKALADRFGARRKFGAAQ